MGVLPAARCGVRLPQPNPRGGGMDCSGSRPRLRPSLWRVWSGPHRSRRGSSARYARPRGARVWIH